MPVRNLILNGTFSDGASSWTGTDIEIQPATQFVGNTTTNRNHGNVWETDGNRNQTSVLTQRFAVDEAGKKGVLSFEAALRDAASSASTGQFRVEVLNNTGNVIFARNIVPGTAGRWTTYTYDVTFPEAGNYTLRLSERNTASSQDDSLGSVVDNISLLVCFTAGTMIRTDRGERPVENLASGDMVWTADGGFQPLVWTGSRLVTAQEQRADARLRPVVFQPGSLGQGPVRRMALSPQHRICVDGPAVALHFAEDEVLAPAIALVNGTTIRQAEPADVTYVHILFADHQIVQADGVRSESFQPSALSLCGLDLAARAEVLRLFPDLHQGRAVMAARRALRMSETRLVA